MVFDLKKFTKLSKKKQIQVGQGIIQKLVEILPFEMHIPGYNYCGPGTKLDKRLERGDKPVNRVDAVCQRHDIAYRDAQNKEDIRSADKRMLKELDSIEKPTVGERVGKLIAKTGIKTKMLLGSGAACPGFTGSGSARTALPGSILTGSGAVNIYCVKCKKQTPTSNPQEVKTKNNRMMLTGTCEVCGSKKCKFIKMS